MHSAVIAPQTGPIRLVFIGWISGDLDEEAVLSELLHTTH